MDDQMLEKIITQKLAIKRNSERMKKKDEKKKIRHIIDNGTNMKAYYQDSGLKYTSNQVMYFLWTFCALLFIIYLIMTYVFSKSNFSYTIIIIILTIVIIYNLVYASQKFINL